MTSLTGERKINGNRVNSGNFNATALIRADKFGHLFFHVFIFGNIFPRGNRVSML